jgi:hypothetical protein
MTIFLKPLSPANVCAVLIQKHFIKKIRVDADIFLNAGKTNTTTLLLKPLQNV